VILTDHWPPNLVLKKSLQKPTTALDARGRRSTLRASAVSAICPVFVLISRMLVPLLAGIFIPFKNRLRGAHREAGSVP
jgi:hypothetical protein